MAIRAIRRSAELEGSRATRATRATRADQLAYARGSITAARLGDHVRRRYNVK